MRKSGLFLIVVVLLAFVPSSLFAQAIVNHDVIEDTFTFRSFNECTGEFMAGEMDVRVIDHSVTNDKRHSYKHTIRFDGYAVGELTGTEYQVKQGWTYKGSYDLEDGYPQVATYPEYLRFISKGSADNLVMKILRHMVWNANGELTVEISDYSWECRG